MFNIFQQDHAKVRFEGGTEAHQAGLENLKKLQANYFGASEEQFKKIRGVTGGRRAILSSQIGSIPTGAGAAGNYITDQIIEGAGKSVEEYERITGETLEKHDNTKGMALHVVRKPVSKLNTAITLYMPASVQVTYGATYNEQEISSLTEKAATAIEQLIKGRFEGAAKTIFSADKTLIDNATQFLLGLAQGFPGLGGARDLEAMKQGRIISNRFELAFKGITKRSFQYTFKMIPRSKEESDMIRKIVRAFKFNMLPEFEGGDLGGRKLIVPNIFDIEYMYNGNLNNYLHKISRCVLESMNVTYGGDRYRTYTATKEGAPPQETNISLNFKEMEMITRRRVEEGF
tara:strand:- start:375 stop:1409 length:1035 start_codon:yes stop_codon:yes gene_type:complete